MVSRPSPQAGVRGREGGRPSVTSGTATVRQTGQYRHAVLSPPEISKLLGISRATVCRYLTLLQNERSDE
jgi:response regulator of citrate/malate metabolism